VLVNFKGERTLISSVLGDLVSRAQGTSVRHTVNVVEMVVGAEGYEGIC
jgi:hypothetical protein